MKNIAIKSIAFLTISFLSFGAMSFPKLPGGVPGLGGGDSSDSGSVDLPSAQANLEKTLKEALANLNKAEFHFATALGDSERAAAAQARANTLSSGGDVDLNTAVEETQSAREASAKAEAGSAALSAEAKAEYAKGLLPYAKGVALTSKVSKQAKTWIDAAQNELKSIKNPMKLGKLRKSLSGGMSIAKAIPKFLKALGKSSKGVFSFAKKQDLNTKKAEKQMPADEF